MTGVEPFRRSKEKSFGTRRPEPERIHALAVRGASPAKGGRSLVLEAILAFVALAALGYVLLTQGMPALPIAAVSPSTSVPHVERVTGQAFALCGNGGGNTCVIDGDTIRIDGVSVRIADIDTPEVRDYGCPAELERGRAATLRMLDLVNAGDFTMRLWDHRDTDMYGRKLRVLERDGQSLGMILVAEGLARPWGGARESWCG